MLETSFGFLRRRGQADLRCRGKVVEHLAPSGIIGGAAAVALVDDDQVEEVGRELLVDVLLFLGAGDSLVEAEVDLKRFVGGAVGDFGHRRAERLEVVGLGLVGEDVAVDEEEDALLGSGLPKPPDDLKGGVGLARAGGHDQQDAIFAARDGIDRAIDGDELVVARRLAGTVVVVILRGNGFLLGGVAFRRADTAPRVPPVSGIGPAESRVRRCRWLPVRSCSRKASPLEL